MKLRLHRGGRGGPESMKPSSDGSSIESSRSRVASSRGEGGSSCDEAEASLFERKTRPNPNIELEFLRN